MRRRHHYATTGNRLLLNVSAGFASGAELFHRNPDIGPCTSETVRRVIMGDIARVADDEVELDIEVAGSAPIERLDIFDGLDLIETIRPYNEADLGSRLRMIYEGAEYRGRSRTTVWDGELTVSGNRIEAAATLNNWNLDRGISEMTSDRLAWKAVTTGNFGGLDLAMQDRDSGSIAVQTPHVMEDIAISDIGMEDMVFEAGGLDRSLKFYRLPDRLSETRLAHRMTVPVASGRDTRLFVRVTQEDGHRAWSSPIYLFR